MARKKNSNRPAPPVGLDGEALAEWGRVCDELEQLGRLNKVDRAVLSLYCRCHQTFTAAFQHVIANGSVVTYSNGMIAPSPQYKIQKEMAQRLESLLTALGLTPAVRAKLDANKKPDVAELEF